MKPIPLWQPWASLYLSGVKLPESVYQEFAAELRQTAKMRPDIQPIPLRVIL